MNETKGQFGHSTKFSFEEFRMMYESTERISERKIQFTRSNASFCALIIAGQAAATGWLFEKREFLSYGITFISLSSVLAALFCFFWINQLLAWKELNNAKFIVMKEMAEHVVFPDYSCTDVSSYNPFEREWSIMEEERRLYESGGKKVLRSHFSEMVVPFGFLTIFSAVFIASALRAFPLIWNFFSAIF